MNIHEANRYISALNLIAEALTTLAGAIEETAWEHIEDHAGAGGVRPVEAAKLTQPPITHTQPSQQQPVQVSLQPGGTPVSDTVPVVSLEQVRGVLADLAGNGMGAQVKALITQAGADKLSAVDPAKYGWLLEQARGLSDAG